MTAWQRHNVRLSRRDMSQRRDLPEGVGTGEGRQWNVSVVGWGRVVAVVDGSGISPHPMCRLRHLYCIILLCEIQTSSL